MVDGTCIWMHVRIVTLSSFTTPLLLKPDSDISSRRTPIGQAIGLATHSLYSPDSETGLLLVGSMNAISAGLLTFASLVELLSEDFLSDDSWRLLRGKNRVFASLLVLFGAFAMSLVGAWA